MLNMCDLMPSVQLCIFSAAFQMCQIATIANITQTQHKTC